MGTVHLLLAIFLLADNLNARPFYDDADENNAKFLEAILYEKTDTLKAAISLLSQLNLPLLCQSVASDPHAQFATVADLLHFATVVVQAQENRTFSSEQATTVSPTIPFDKITSVYPRAVTETVTEAAENSKELTFPRTKQLDYDYKSVHDIDSKERANGKLLSKETVVVKSVDSIYGDNDLESAARLMENKTKSSDRIRKEGLKVVTDAETTKTWSTTGGITGDSTPVVQSTDGKMDMPTKGLTLPSAQTPTTTRMPTDVLDVTADYGNEIPANRVTQKIKRPQNLYLDRSDQKPSSPTSVVSEIETTTPLHWLIRDKWPEMEQRTEEMLKERQLTSEELRREIISTLENDTAPLNNSSVQLSKNTSNYEQTTENATDVTSATRSSTSTNTELHTTPEVSSKTTAASRTTGKTPATETSDITKDTQLASTTTVYASTPAKQTTLKKTTTFSTPAKKTKATLNQTTTFSTPVKQTKATFNKTTTFSTPVKQTEARHNQPSTLPKSSSSVTMASSTFSSSTTRASHTSTETTTHVKTDSTTQSSTHKNVKVNNPSSTKIPSTTSQTTTTQTTPEPNSSTTTAMTQSNTNNTTVVNNISISTVAPKKTTAKPDPKPTLGSKSVNKASTSVPVNVSKILELTKSATPLTRSPTTQVTASVNLTSDQTSPAPISTVNTSVKQKHITLNRENGVKTTSVPQKIISANSDINNMTETTTLTDTPKNISTTKTPSITTTKAPVSTTTTTTTRTTTTTASPPKTAQDMSSTKARENIITDSESTMPSITSTKYPSTSATTATTGKTSASTITTATATTTAETTTTTAATTRKISTPTKPVFKHTTIKKQDILFQTKGVFPWELDPKQKPTLREKIVPVQNSRDSERTDIKDYGNELTEDDSKQKNFISPGQTDDENFGFFTCPTIFGFYPDAINCGQFYICSWSIPYHFDCPVGTVWNIELTVCDWPFNVNCGTRPWFGRTAFEKHFLPRQL